MGDVIKAPENTARHIAQVLRLRVNDEVTLFAGDGMEYRAKILDVSKKQLSLEITTAIANSLESNIRIHLIQAVSKGDRMDWVIQKAVELGVTSIQPVTSSRTHVNLSVERFEKKRLHWQAVAIAACEQCGRNVVPEVRPVAALFDVAQGYRAHSSMQKILLSPQSNAKYRHDKSTADDFLLAIGPEGGFSDQEEQQLIALGFESYRLGPRILRTETAAITAISILQAYHGDL